MLPDNSSILESLATVAAVTDAGGPKAVSAVAHELGVSEDAVLLWFVMSKQAVALNVNDLRDVNQRILKLQACVLLIDLESPSCRTDSAFEQTGSCLKVRQYGDHTRRHLRLVMLAAHWDWHAGTTTTIHAGQDPRI